jgi:hypothetical protein
VRKIDFAACAIARSRADKVFKPIDLQYMAGGVRGTGTINSYNASAPQRSTQRDMPTRSGNNSICETTA